jgi:membrane protein
MNERDSLLPGPLGALARRWLWDIDIDSLPAWRRLVLWTLRIGQACLRDLAEGQLTLRAMSLVYTTLLSLVPLLAISFSVLKGFGVHNQVEPLLLGFLEPLGDQGVEISARIVGFVDNIKVGVLGFLGFVLLFYTVISLMQKIERAFNYTWRIGRERTLGQRFRDYFSVVVIGPVLVFSSLSITASIMSDAVVQALAAIEPFGTLLHLAGWLVPYLLIVAAFTFIYAFMPNTRVRLPSALVGGLVAGVLWNAAGWAFASFVVSTAKFTAIYSTFATLIMFMIWLYLAWLILLTGASIAFYHQNPEYIRAGRGVLHLSNRLRERLALTLAALIGARHYAAAPPWTAEALTREVNLPLEATVSVLAGLEAAGLLSRSAAEPPAYLPGRPFDETPIASLLEAVRRADEPSYLGPAQMPDDAAVGQLIATLDEARAAALAGRTLKDLVMESEERPEIKIAG